MNKKQETQAASVDRVVMPRKVNDAVIATWFGISDIVRVIAVTEFGRAVVEPIPGCIKVESKPGEFMKVGSLPEGGFRFKPQ